MNERSQQQKADDYCQGHSQGKKTAGIFLSLPPIFKSLKANLRIETGLNVGGKKKEKSF